HRLRVDHVAADLQAVVLERESIALETRACAGYRAQRLDELDPPEGLTLVDELLVGHAGQLVKAPPERLVLAPVPVEELGQQPTSLLWIGPFPPLGGDALREPGAAGGNLLLALGGRPRGRRLALLARAWQPRPDLASKIQAACLQPVPEPQVAHDVVAVVARAG